MGLTLLIYLSIVLGKNIRFTDVDLLSERLITVNQRLVYHELMKSLPELASKNASERYPSSHGASDRVERMDIECVYLSVYA